MQEFIIEGGYPIQGEITPQGNKNEALPVLCAALISNKKNKIFNIPDIEDIKSLLKILEYLGAEIHPIKNDIHNLEIEVNEITTSELPAELSASLRGSVTLMGPLLARTGKIFLPRPGGDKIGRRRIDTHLLAFEALGATVEVFQHGYLIQAEKLIGAEMLLDEASVTGTENAIMVAVMAEGSTVIRNAASEPHVQGLCHFLLSMGVKIEGIGSNVLTIYGLKQSEMKSAEHVIGPDYLEIGSFISMAAITNGHLQINDVRVSDLPMIKKIFSKMGIDFYYEKDKKNKNQMNLILPKNQLLEIQTDVHNEIPKIDDAPWPAFPADLISIALMTATQCKGTVLFHEKLFESRLFFVDKLISMGAKIVLCDPHRAVVVGASKLYGARMSSPDIRAGMALVIAALSSEGVSHIQNILQIDRGYEDIDNRLKKLGAKISRVNS